jgi:hypothetical protein
MIKDKYTLKGKLFFAVENYFIDRKKYKVLRNEVLNYCSSMKSKLFLYPTSYAKGVESTIEYFAKIVYMNKPFIFGYSSCIYNISKEIQYYQYICSKSLTKETSFNKARISICKKLMKIAE